MPGIDLNQVCIKLRDLDIVPREVAIRHKLLPVLVREDRVFVAMASPTEKKVIDEIEFVTGKRVFPYVALAGPLMRAISASYEMRDRGEAFYVGPQCPPEIQRKAGFLPKASPDDPPGATGRAPARRGPPGQAPRRAASSSGRRAPAAPAAAPDADAPAQSSDHRGRRRARAQVGSRRGLRPANARVPAETSAVVDDAMGRMTVADELTDADFGSVDRELSAMGELPRDPMAKEPPADGKQTVLVVDDEADIRKLVRRVPRGSRLPRDRGRPRPQALAMLKERPPDLVVLDAMLPEVHGFDIAKRMKGSERYGNIPIVMISAVYRGWRFAEDLRQSYGVDAYLEKPFKMSDLVSAVETALSRRPAASDVERISAEAEKKLAQGIEAYQKGDIATRRRAPARGAPTWTPWPTGYTSTWACSTGKQGRVYDAIQELQTALDINRQHFPALKNLAVLYQKAGFRNKAIETWERALRVAPDDPTRLSIKEHLVGLL